MTKSEKKAVIEEIAEKLQGTQYFYVTDASGLSVEQVNTVRRRCFESGVEYKVYKNTLIQKAIESVEAVDNSIGNVLKGFSGIIFSPESSNAPARVIKGLRKEGFEKPVLKAASIDGDLYIGDNSVEELSNLKSKTELIGDVIGLLQAPATNVISALQSGGNNLSGLLKALAEKEG
jgi:large subunit ribosomal protein L10